MSTEERIIAERREKAGQLREQGRNPYRNDFKPSHAVADVRAKYEGTKPEEPAPGIHPVDDQSYRVAGRITAKRGFGKTVFAPLRDATGEIQLFINVEHVDPADFDKVKPLLDAGDIVGAEGPVFWTKRGEMSILVKKLEIITKSLRPLPDKWAGLTDVETRYRQRWLDLAVSREVQEVFRKRSQIIRGMRAFLDARGYLEVETPMMHPIIGGAAARPFVTHHNTLDMKLFMRIAPELYLKRLVVGGFERVYEINRNFRNEGLSRQHNPEFTMLEFYQAYATYEDLMDLTEEMLSGLAMDVNGTHQAPWGDQVIDLSPGWKRISVRQAVVELGGQDPAIFDDPARAAAAALAVGVPAADVCAALLEGLDADAVTELAGTGGVDGVRGVVKAFTERPDALAAKIVERYPDDLEGRVRAAHIGYMIFDQTVEEKLVQPTFLTDFPLAVSPLARKKESDPAYCDRFELFVNGMEIGNAFSELNDPDDQRARFLAQLRAREQGADETMDYDEDYCRALELGMPSAAGEGIGIDRVVMMLTNQDSIRDVILFPLMRPE
jgi:lysyl-tRNA synthetase class 2